jgi:NAD(P)-dependent dehydrogenase (short-subunit alcohol dehydrogenase family)
MASPLSGRIALVAGATRGAGRDIAVQLGAAGATVYCTGRSTRAQRSEMNRPETIEETAELVTAAGGRGLAVQVDHLVPEQVRDLVARIDREQGTLHILVNDIRGATTPVVGLATGHYTGAAISGALLAIVVVSWWLAARRRVPSARYRVAIATIVAYWIYFDVGLALSA